MAVPLVVGDKIVGVLNLQSDRANGLSQDNLAAFETLAGLIAIAIENANLFAETTAARAEVETYLRRVTREGWSNYQDAIVRPEAMGMVYEDGTTQQLSETESFSAGANGLQVPITIANEVVGSIQLETDVGHEWSEEEKGLISAVAQQVGQQAESLRLLTETERYRAEAEQAARRLSGEAWREFLGEKRAQQNQGFVYTNNLVTPITEDSLPEGATVRQLLKIQDESIGELLVAGVNQEEAQALLASVSNQLSRHLENIRLVQQTESALGQTESLYQIGHEMNIAANVDEILHAALGPIFPTGIDEATLMFMELDTQGQPQTLELLAGWRPDGKLSFPVGTVFPIARFPFTSLFINDPDGPQLIGDAATDPRVDEFTRGVMAHAGIKAIAVIPLTMGGQWVGIITCSWPQARTFSKQEEEIFHSLINIAAPAVQSQRLFFKTKAQADKEHLINAINQRIQNTVSVESALQTAVKELGQALQTKTLVKLNMDTEKQKHNHKEAEAISAD
jgi:GAF domain-containing protein